MEKKKSINNKKNVNANKYMSPILSFDDIKKDVIKEDDETTLPKPEQFDMPKVEAEKERKRLQDNPNVDILKLIGTLRGKTSLQPDIERYIEMILPSGTNTSNYREIINGFLNFITEFAEQDITEMSETASKKHEEEYDEDVSSDIDIEKRLDKLMNEMGYGNQ